MLPTAVVMMGFWWISAVWLREQRERAGLPIGAANRWMLMLGLLACVGLILYVTVLTEVGDIWRRQRRIGVVLFFSFTYIAQLLWLAQLRDAAAPQSTRLVKGMWGLCLALLVIGVLTVILEAVNEAWYDTVEDAFEWVLALMLQTNFLLAWWVWRLQPWAFSVGDGHATVSR
jgi:hypothetical protein